jgi:hypothetical protein
MSGCTQLEDWQSLVSRERLKSSAFEKAEIMTFSNREEWASLGLDSTPLDLIYRHKDMAAACDSPVTTLPVPIAVPMTAPITGVPIATSVDSSCTVPMYNSPIVSTGMISTVSSTNGRTTSSVHRRAITSLNCRASTIVGYFITIFPLISISEKSGA